MKGLADYWRKLAVAPDAAPEALSEPVERSETSGGIGTASNSSTGTAGLSEPHAFVVCATCNGSGGYCQRCREGQAGLPHSAHIVTCPDCLGGGTYPPATEDSMAEPTHDEHLTQIRDRSRRLAEIPLETSASNYIMRDMIDSIGDVRWLLEEQQQQQQSWPRARSMPLAIAGGLMQPWHYQALAEYEAAHGTTIRPDSNLPGMFAAAQINQAITWWNERAEAEQQPEDGGRG